jgi:hypothetical protein
MPEGNVIFVGRRMNMLTTIEAEVDVNGIVTLLEPIKLNKKSRAIVTFLESAEGIGKPLTEEEERIAEERFARWIGAASLGHPAGVDNESIDAVLAREYAATHEEQN